MNLLIRCDHPGCGYQGSFPGWEEHDTNAAGVNDDCDMSEACEHIQAGGSYTIMDSEAEELDPEHWLQLGSDF